ncbi:ATP-grasp domain-containing protein [Streptomyces cinerochromogenes]|uniref:ATP-grasp domain-containing protein n=1 Tax=Streptomyces cinerochromogenes TaxID=66422 RepID=UPI0036A9E178
MIFFVEAPLTGSGLSALAWAVAQGIDAALVTTDPAKYRGAVGAEVLPGLAGRGRLYVVETTEGEAVPAGLLDAAREHTGSGRPGVVCATDRHLLFAAALAEAIGAPFAPVEAVRTFRDKRRARELYEKLGIPSPRWAEARTADELRAFAEDTGRPVVLKNARGTGSLDVLLCRTPEEAVAAYGTLTAGDLYLDGELMAEEYVSGPLYSLETLVTDGRCRHLGVTDRQLGPRPAFCEVSYTFPVRVPERAEARMRAAVETLVEATGIAQGMLHTEFILTDGDEAVVVEVNARTGGGLLSLMMNDCLTVPVPELLCSAALGRPVADPRHNGSYSSTVTVYAPRAGRLSRVHGLAEAGDGPHVVQVVRGAAPGDEVRAAGDYRGAVGQIRTRAGSANLALNAALAAARDVVVEVTG